MKKSGVTILLLFTFFFSFSQHGKIRIKEINYGLAQAQKVSQEEMKNSPSGLHSYSENLKIIRKTNAIPATLGNRFAIEYELISDKSQVVTLEIKWIFPKGMVDVNGKAMKKLKYLTTVGTNQYTYSAYVLENENELVRGKWILIIKTGRKKLFHRKFNLI